MSRPKLFPFYALRESISGKARNCLTKKEIDAFVMQGHATWIKSGTAAQETEPIEEETFELTASGGAESGGARTAVARVAAITHKESAANAGADSSDIRIAIARQKVGAWLSVYDGYSPLLGRPGAIKTMERKQLQGSFAGAVLEEEREDYLQLLCREEQMENRHVDLRGEILKEILSDDPDRAYRFESPEEENERKHGQADAYECEGMALDAKSSAARIATWECGECGRTFGLLYIDDSPECCPHCESANIQDIPWDEIPWDIDTRDEEPLSAMTNEKPIPAILTDAARSDGDLEQLLHTHKTGLLQDQDENAAK